jgi:hypothetical protein
MKSRSLSSDVGLTAGWCSADVVEVPVSFSLLAVGVVWTMGVLADLLLAVVPWCVGGVDELQPATARRSTKPCIDVLML